MGGKLGTIFARAGHEVTFSYARSEQKLKRLAREAKGKARAGTPLGAAQEADALLLAVHWSRIEDVLNQTGDLSGKARHRQIGGANKSIVPTADATPKGLQRCPLTSAQLTPCARTEHRRTSRSTSIGLAI